MFTVGQRVQDNYNGEYGTIAEVVVPPVPGDTYYWVEQENYYSYFLSRTEEEISAIPEIGDTVTIAVPDNDVDGKPEHAWANYNGRVVAHAKSLIRWCVIVSVEIKPMHRRHGIKREEVCFAPNELFIR